MEYEHVAKLRSVNRWLNFKCSKYLTETFFKIIKDIESYIFESFDDLKVDGKLPSEIIKTFGVDNSYIDYGLLKPTINQILFANKLLLILIILPSGIFRYMFYRNHKSADEHFVFIYGNCLDWAAREMNRAKHESVTMRDTASLIPPPEVRQHLDQITAFYKGKIRLSRSQLGKYKGHRSELGHSYTRDVRPVVMEVEMLFFATHSLHSLPPQFKRNLPDYAFDIFAGYVNNNLRDLYNRAIFFIAGEAIKFYLKYMGGMETEFRVLSDPRLNIYHCDGRKYMHYYINLL